MPPEQRFQQFNKTTDIYSLGMSIVCWLTRTEPTEMYNIINMGTNQVMGLRELLSAYSLRFVDWLEKVVQPDPKDRYPDAEAAFNAFKPLYVKRVPEAIVSSSVLEFTASKLGERITQTLTVRNNVPETVLEGWWEVASHPSDPPHTPNSHAWISFGSRKFSGNTNECSIVVNTDKLMAGKVYKRQILLHSNSSEDVEKLDLIVNTAEIPIRADKLPYFGLIFLLLMVIPTTTLTTTMTFVIVSFLTSGDFIRNDANYHNNLVGTIGTTIFTVLFCLATITIVRIILEHKLEYNPLHLYRSMLATIFSGISISLYLWFRSQNIWFIFSMFLTSGLFIITLLHPTIKHKKLVSKYRNSEEGLIKP
jgi:serine/threonine protein kinase